MTGDGTHQPDLRQLVRAADIEVCGARKEQRRAFHPHP